MKGREEGRREDKRREEERRAGPQSETCHYPVIRYILYTSPHLSLSLFHSTWKPQEQNVIQLTIAI